MPRSRLQSGEKTLISEPRELSFETAPDLGYEISVGQQDSGELFLAVPVTMPPGTYDLTLTLGRAETDAVQAVLRVTVEPLPALAIGTRTPVVLMNGLQLSLFSTCPVSSSSEGSFGSLENYLNSDGVPGVLFFDNCRECPDCAIEDLGSRLGQVLSTLRYTDGTPVPEVDVVAHSMGGLIARAYLSGKQKGSNLFSPPATTRIRKLVFTGTPHFGAGLADLALGLGGDQINSMRLGSGLLWLLAQWNQDFDDLRGIEAISVIGAGGYSGDAKGASDGVVALTSASLSFAAGVTNERTRIVPYCHIDSSLLRCHNRTGLAKVDSPAHLTSRIVRSFLTGTNEWRSVGWTPSQDPYLSRFGGVYFTFQDANGNLFSDVDQVSFVAADGTHLLARRGSIFYAEWVPHGTYTYQISLRGQTWPVDISTPTNGFGLRSAKFGPVLSIVLPAAGVPDTLNLAAGTLISTYGRDLANAVFSSTTFPLPTEVAGTRLTANGQPLSLLYVGPGQINAYLPPHLFGLVQLRVSNPGGQDTTTLWIEPSVPAIFTLNGTGTGPAAAINALTGQIISANGRVEPGDYVALFVTGLGPTYLSGGVERAFTTPRLFLGGREVTVLFAGLAPGFVGLYQVNFQIPPWVQRDSAVQLYLAGPRFTSNVVTLAIQ